MPEYNYNGMVGWRGDDPIPDVFTPVIGFRRYRITLNEETKKWELRSPIQDTVWTTSKMTAQCIRQVFTWTHFTGASYVTEERKHAAPEHECRCGIYAYYDPPHQEMSEYVSARWDKPNSFPVVACITLTGVIEVHEKGMRGQYAQVHCITCPAPKEGIVKPLAKKMGLEIVEYDSLREAATRYGEPLDASFRPQNPLRIDP